MAPLVGRAQSEAKQAPRQHAEREEEAGQKHKALWTLRQPALPLQITLWGREEGVGCGRAQSETTKTPV